MARVQHRTSSHRDLHKWGARMTTRIEAARFILAEAEALGMSVGTNGTELLLSAPLRIPRASCRTFEDALQAYRAEIIEIVMREGTL
jgi:hypothetical protein